MSFTFRPAKRENVPLLLGVAGGTGSGKTMSALRLAKGIAGKDRFYVIDTENGRAKHYADQFEFQYGELHAPFTPGRYAEAIEAAVKDGAKVIVVDSTSHEHAGDGGLLDMHDAEFQRMGSRDAVKMAAWIKPKAEHKKFVTKLLQVNAHVILCFRAEEKIEITKDAQGKTVVVPKKTLTGLNGWVPISERNLPYELTASFLLTADQPGVPKPIKLQEQHRALVPLDQPLTEAVGERLAEWARGGALSEPGNAPGLASPGSENAIAQLTAHLTGLLNDIGKPEAITAVAKHRAANDDKKHAAWLRRQIAAAEAVEGSSPPKEPQTRDGDDAGQRDLIPAAPVSSDRPQQSLIDMVPQQVRENMRG